MRQDIDALTFAVWALREEDGFKSALWFRFSRSRRSSWEDVATAKTVNSQ